MRKCWRLSEIFFRFDFSSAGSVLANTSKSQLNNVKETLHSGNSVGFSTSLQRCYLKTQYHRRHSEMSGKSEGWQTFGNYSVYAWSLSGVETCIVVRSDDLKIAFDMGSSIPESISCGNVFISHGHIDHIGAVSNHVAKRGLFNMNKAHYYVPPHLVEPLRAITDASFTMAVTTEALQDVHVLPFHVEDTVKLPNNYSMKSFPTVHRIPSQGYILYKTEKTLKPQYVGQPSSDIAKLHRSNVDIFDVNTTPEVAYTGDTMIEVFTSPPSPDLLRVKLLIMEATYLDQSSKKDSVQLARDRGHTHLQEINKNAHLFAHVDHILLMHFSTKYSGHFVQEYTSKHLAPELRHKVFCATVAKETTS